MTTCRLCFTTPAKTYMVSGLQSCIACCDEFSELSCLQDIPAELIAGEGDKTIRTNVNSMFWYAGSIRKLVIAAKVKSDATALRRLLTIWETELTNLPTIGNVDAVMPCPSSLWSRLHGRIDIAWFLAERVARIYRIPLILPPRHTYWNLKKRSQTIRPVDNLFTTSQTVEANHAKPPQLYSENCSHYLLIDDVVTTGTTVRNCIIASKINTNTQVSTLTFSKSRKLSP